MPEVSDLTAREELPKAGMITGVKSYQGSRLGRCGWITSFLGKKSKGLVYCLVISNKEVPTKWEDALLQRITQ